LQGRIADCHARARRLRITCRGRTA
jgi:hypothetical protein